MQVAPIARFAVPTGTAAAVVVMRDPTGDPVLDGRRFVALEALDDQGFRAAFEELIVAGVYTVLTDRLLVLRVSSHGSKVYAVACALLGEKAIPAQRAGLTVHAATVEPLQQRDDLESLLEAEAKQRPVFHGMTAEGVTYTGFEARETSSILAAASTSLPTNVAPAAVAFLFAGKAVELPDGLVVGFHPAPF